MLNEQHSLPLTTSHFSNLSILTLLQWDAGDKTVTHAPHSSAVCITYKPTHTCHKGAEAAGGWDSEALLLNGGGTNSCLYLDLCEDNSLPWTLKPGPNSQTVRVKCKTHTGPTHSSAAVTDLSPTLQSQGWSSPHSRSRLPFFTAFLSQMLSPLKGCVGGGFFHVYEGECS